MRTMVIIFAFAAVAFGWGVPTLADNALCNRVMVAIAHARGDATEEFKRRVVFLFETGKIGDEHLARILVSETAVVPFAVDQHRPAELVPHVTAFERLVGNKALDWKEVRRFIDELRSNVARAEETRKQNEDNTRGIFYPQQLTWLSDKFGYQVAATGFEKNGKFHIVTISLSGVLVVRELGAAKPVMSIRKKGWRSGCSPVVFEEDGRTYITIGTDNGVLYVIDAFTGREVSKAKFGNTIFGVPRVFERGGKKYVVAQWQGVDIPVVEASTGKIVTTLLTGGVEGVEPALFERNGKTYLVALVNREQADGQARSVIAVWDMLTGESVREIVLAKPESNDRPLPAGLFWENENFYAIAAAEDECVYVTDVRSGKIVNRFKLKWSRSHSRRIEGGAFGFVSLFEQGGKGYILTKPNGRTFNVVEALTGKLVQSIVLKDPPQAGPVVLKWKDGAYALFGIPYSSLRVYDILEGREYAEVQIPEALGGVDDIFPAFLFGGSVVTVVKTPEGKLGLVGMLPDKETGK